MLNIPLFVGICYLLQWDDQCRLLFIILSCQIFLGFSPDLVCTRSFDNKCRMLVDQVRACQCDSTSLVRYDLLSKIFMICYFISFVWVIYDFMCHFLCLNHLCLAIMLTFRLLLTSMGPWIWILTRLYINVCSL